MKPKYCDVIVKPIIIGNLVEKDYQRVTGNDVTRLTSAFIDDGSRLRPVLLDSEAVSHCHW